MLKKKVYLLSIYYAVQNYKVELRNLKFDDYKELKKNQW
jgi:hypothetical protein